MHSMKFMTTFTSPYILDNKKQNNCIASWNNNIKDVLKQIKQFSIINLSGKDENAIKDDEISNNILYEYMYNINKFNLSTLSAKITLTGSDINNDVEQSSWDKFMKVLKPDTLEMFRL